jgi:Ran GTPase-activating protein (RanGAP) involved in mRNA processing and transport
MLLRTLLLILVELEKIEGLTETIFGANSYGVEAFESTCQGIRASIFTVRLRGEIPESLNAILTVLLTCENRSAKNKYYN